MLLVREIFHCKPGKVRPFVEKFHAMAKLGEAAGQGKTRILTDFSGVRYWTCVAEFEVPDLATFEKMMRGEGHRRAGADRDDPCAALEQRLDCTRGAPQARRERHCAAKP